MEQDEKQLSPLAGVISFSLILSVLWYLLPRYYLMLLAGVFFVGICLFGPMFGIPGRPSPRQEKILTWLWFPSLFNGLFCVVSLILSFYFHWKGSDLQWTWIYVVFGCFLFTISYLWWLFRESD